MLLAATEALTVTSKKLAGLYTDGKGKGKGKAKPADKKGKGKGGKTKSQGTPKGPSGKGNGNGNGKGKKGPGKMPPTAERQQRLQGALCLGCGASNHWIRDCPHVTLFQAQLASAEAYAEVSFEEQNVCYQIPRPPSIMLSTCSDASYMIADTGCQRQVAGSVWHQQRHSEIVPLSPLRNDETCRFSFGPTQGMQSKGRYLYPSGIVGEVVMLGISEVEAPAPGLLSRPAMEALGAVPDVQAGKIYFRALDKSTSLFLSPCRHLLLESR